MSRKDFVTHKYGEYQTSLVYNDRPGSAVKNSYRVNVTYTMPVGL